MNNKIVEKFEKIVDEKCSEMKIWEFNRDDALSIVGVNAEILWNKLKKEKDIPKKITMANEIFYTTNWLIKQIHLRCLIVNGKNLNDLLISDYHNLVYETFESGGIHAAMFEIFPSFWNGIYDLDLRNTNEKKISFIYKTENIAKFEAINGIILHKKNLEFQEKHKQIMLSAPKGNLEKYYKFIVSEWVDLLFSIKEDYKISDYSIKDLKLVLKYLYYETIVKDRENTLKNDPYSIEILLLNENSWKEQVVGVKKELIIKILDDLTFTSLDYATQKKSNPFLSPIFTLNNSKVLIPHFIFQNSIQRNILTSLIRKYEEANYDSALRIHLITDPITLFIKHRFIHLEIYEEVAINGSDIDYIIYDKIKSNAIIFEIKSFSEPITALEIKNKDKDIRKGIQNQLKKHKEYLENTDNLLSLQSQISVPKLSNLHYFLLTQTTIGSGEVDRSEFNTINVELLIKCLVMSNGDLEVCSKLLNSNDLLPKEQIDYEIISKKYNIDDEIEICIEGIKFLDFSNFSL
ncbi:hypothetical protein [Exiguobacterium sp. UBA5002]|uniref:hypothetical protein n=1 Tax=Exiguobacterium sp. UBA5002 TaxID=1946497 RepID=UPI0025C1F09B|nr:hypothetical protein [Exiguobacterium sp. UBA5002]